MGNDKKDTKALAGGAVVLSTVALVAALTKKAKAAPPEGIITVTLDEETRQALAMIISQQADALTKLDTANLTLTAIAEALGAEPPVIEERILAPFREQNETLQHGTPFAVFESKPGKGALIWAIFDVSDPDTEVSLRIDDLVWNFKIDTLLAQGVQQPLFPGAWVSRADALSGHYCIVFSAGTIDGFIHTQRLIISVTFKGLGTATLHEARGIRWTYL